MGYKRCPWWVIAILFLVVWLHIINAGVEAVGSLADKAPENFKYTHLWTSQDGETHIKECKMHNFSLQDYSSLPQYVRTDFGGLPIKMIFTQLSVGFTQPLHSTPNVQFVITLAGSWYINTTDGSEMAFKHGEVLFQDNIVGSPAAKVPQHYSGNIGSIPCQQFIVQFNRTAEVDHPCPFS